MRRADAKNRLGQRPGQKSGPGGSLRHSPDKSCAKSNPEAPSGQKPAESGKIPSGHARENPEISASGIPYALSGVLCAHSVSSEAEAERGTIRAIGADPSVQTVQVPGSSGEGPRHQARNSNDLGEKLLLLKRVIKGDRSNAEGAGDDRIGARVQISASLIVREVFFERRLGKSRSSWGSGRELMVMDEP